MCPECIDEDGCINKTSGMLNKWYVELKKCSSEDYKINTSHSEHYL